MKVLVSPCVRTSVRAFSSAWGVNVSDSLQSKHLRRGKTINMKKTAVSCGAIMSEGAPWVFFRLANLGHPTSEFSRVFSFSAARNKAYAHPTTQHSAQLSAC